jgi:hypothetical protein
MRDTDVQMGTTSLRASQPRLRRRPIGPAAELAAAADRTGPDVSHLIGFGILLTAALLIAIGSFATSARSAGASSAAEASAYATVATRGSRQ